MRAWAPGTGASRLGCPDKETAVRFRRAGGLRHVMQATPSLAFEVVSDHPEARSRAVVDEHTSADALREHA